MSLNYSLKRRNMYINLPPCHNFRAIVAKSGEGCQHVAGLSILNLIYLAYSIVTATHHLKSQKTIYNMSLSDEPTIMNQRITLFDIIILQVTSNILIDRRWWSFKPIHTLGGVVFVPGVFTTSVPSVRKRASAECAFLKLELLVVGDKVWEICRVWCSVFYLLSRCLLPTLTPPNSNTVKIILYVEVKTMVRLR